MSANELLDRMLAWDEGRPIPTTDALPFPRATDADRLVLAFVRMGGESSPWGVVLGKPGDVPQCFTAPEPRNADLHAEFIEHVVPSLLAHVGHRVIVIELAGGLRALPGLADADAAAWVGQTVGFLDQGVVGISLRKGIRVGDADGPGAWLTHAAPLPEPSPSGLIRPDLVDLVKGLQ